MTDTPLETALRIALTLLSGEVFDDATIEAGCDMALASMQSMKKDLPDREELIRQVESRVIVWQENSTSLEDRTGHTEWLPGKRAEIDWRWWDRYKRFLQDAELMPPKVVIAVDESTDRVLAKLEDPARNGEWQRKGLVVGHVQSGKTSHYTGLICKAADAGYKLIVVLAGLHDSLRSQTQLRLDEGFLGIDTQYAHRSDEKSSVPIGAAALTGADRILAGSLTTSDAKGDFKRAVAKNIVLPIGDIPVLLVVKKNTSILRNLIRWVTEIHGVPVSQDSAEKIVRGVPLLVIDDEADSASIDVGSKTDMPSETNKQLRRLLNTFEKSAYVGYTATPYANIFASTANHDEWGDDIYPRSFIESLKPPSNYFGPVRVFGLAATADDDVDQPPLPVFRDADDYQTWIPDKHKKTWVPGELPGSVKEAVLAFALSSAARRARGQGSKHSSMLIHVTRFQDVQKRVYDQLQEHLQSIRLRLKFGDGESHSIYEELRELWEGDFEQTTLRWPGETITMSWDVIEPHVLPAVEKIEMLLLNGSSEDALEYHRHREHGLSVIAVGGNKLSRGLTLEGLSVSYYLRATRMYDTLMQMGRWFGYRPGYEDLCRLYTTTTLRDWYREVTAATEELREDFDDMAARKLTPADYGLRVRSSPALLRVTAPNKMRNAETVQISFSGALSETVTFDVSGATISKNQDTLGKFVGHLVKTYGEPDWVRNHKGNPTWLEVSGTDVAEQFFEKYVADRMASRAKPSWIARYIKEAVKRGELTDWTVVLLDSKSGVAEHVPIGGLTIGLTVRRALDKDEPEASKRYTIRRILSPGHESLDLSDSQKRQALDELEAEIEERSPGEGKIQTIPRGPSLRRQRDPSRGLLLVYPLLQGEKKEEYMVGFGASFSFSRVPNLGAKYAVSEVWKAMEFDDLGADDDDDLDD